MQICPVQVQISLVLTRTSKEPILGHYRKVNWDSSLPTGRPISTNPSRGSREDYSSSLWAHTGWQSGEGGGLVSLLHPQLEQSWQPSCCPTQTCDRVVVTSWVVEGESLWAAKKDRVGVGGSPEEASLLRGEKTAVTHTTWKIKNTYWKSLNAQNNKSLYCLVYRFFPQGQGLVGSVTRWFCETLTSLVMWKTTVWR